MAGHGVDAPQPAVSDGGPPAPGSTSVDAPRSASGGAAGSTVSGARRWIGGAGLALGAVLVAVITLTPDPVDSNHRALVRELIAFLHAHGAPPQLGYAALEFTANIVMFVPLGFFAALLLPLGRAWLAALLAVGFSAAVEAVQLLLLPARFATLLDVLANALGAAVGVGVAVLLRVCVAARDKRLLREAHARAGAAPGSPPGAAPLTAPSRSR